MVERPSYPGSTEAMRWRVLDTYLDGGSYVQRLGHDLHKDHKVRHADTEPSDDVEWV